jgi:5-methylcytosine-specific restriction enzyme A
LASRKSFIEKTGATCANWNWSWSFVNHEKKFVIFTAWKDILSDGRCLILSRSWVGADGKLKLGFHQSLENTRHIAEEGYKLFLLVTIEKLPHSEPRKIASFDEIMKHAELSNIDDDWFASIIKKDAGLVK